MTRPAALPNRIPAPGAPEAGGAGPGANARLGAEIATLLVMVTWGANVVAVKAAIADVPPIIFTMTRFVLAFLVLLALLRWREGSVSLPRRDALSIALLGLVGFGLYQDLWASALGQTTAANSALLTAATPVSTLLLAAAVGSDTLSPAKAIGAAISFGGAVGVVAATHGFGLTGASGGDLMTLVATVCWACYVAFGTPVLRRYSALRTATWAIGFGCLGMLPVALLELPQFVPAHVGLGTLGLLAYCALLPAAASNVVVFAAIKILGPTRVMLFQFLVPAFAVVMAAFFLGEAIVPGQLLGGLVIVLGILVARSRRLAAAVG
ncbi:MAG: DMT family transporter [Candidatus Limnocylindrales bacterium]|jgi:drug/metabolite transporter (DMT)-like permease